MRMVELFTTGPAKVIGLEQGTLRKGAAADITILDLDRAWTFDASKSHSKSKNSPFDRREFRGGAVETIVGGETVWSADGGFAEVAE